MKLRVTYGGSFFYVVEKCNHIKYVLKNNNWRNRKENCMHKTTMKLTEEDKKKIVWTINDYIVFDTAKDTVIYVMSKFVGMDFAMRILNQYDEITGQTTLSSILETLCSNPSFDDVKIAIGQELAARLDT